MLFDVSNRKQYTKKEKVSIFVIYWRWSLLWDILLPLPEIWDPWLEQFELPSHEFDWLRLIGAGAATVLTVMMMPVMMIPVVSSKYYCRNCSCCSDKHWHYRCNWSTRTINRGCGCIFANIWITGIRRWSCSFCSYLPSEWSFECMVAFPFIKLGSRSISCLEGITSISTRSAKKIVLQKRADFIRQPQHL